MFSIQLFSLHMEFSIRKKEISAKKLTKIANVREIEQSIEANRMKYTQQVRFM